MDELIEYLRGVAENANLPLTMRDMLAQAAAALEAAREDAERWRHAFVDERASRYRADGMKIEQARIHAETDAEVAAIDQARGKGGQEVE